MGKTPQEGQGPPRAVEPMMIMMMITVISDGNILVSSLIKS
jgi:hypothetical protein